MKLSRRGKRTKRTKRTKCTKRTKNIKCRRNTKRHLNKYRRKNTYRKHSHKLRKNKRVMRGGVPIIDLLDKNNKFVNLRYKKEDSFFSDTGEFSLTGGRFSGSTENPGPKQGQCDGKEYSITFTLTRKKDSKKFTISFKVLYKMVHYNLIELIISTLNTNNTNDYEKFCTVTKNMSNPFTGERQFSSDLKLNDGESIYTFPLSSTRNKDFFDYLVIYIAGKFGVCESQKQSTPTTPKEFNAWTSENTPGYVTQYGHKMMEDSAYLGTEDPLYKKWRLENQENPLPPDTTNQ